MSLFGSILEKIVTVFLVNKLKVFILMNNTKDYDHLDKDYFSSDRTMT